VERRKSGSSFEHPKRQIRPFRAIGEHALVVSHYYHLPRIKLLYAREGTSHQMWTVPATMDRRLVREPYYLVREIASTYHELIFRSKIGPHLKRWLER
jgi:uncharacterized SAM-binding protein YcdF (DUF218 family)